MEKKLCYCKRCGAVSIDIRKHSKGALLTPIDGEVDIVMMKDMNGNTIYICPKCKDGVFKTIQDSGELIEARNNYIIKEEERKKYEAEQNELQRNNPLLQKPKSPFGGKF